MLRQTASILVKVQGSCPKVFPLLLGGLGNHSALATIMSLILVVYCLDKNSLFKPKRKSVPCTATRILSLPFFLLIASIAFIKAACFPDQSGQTNLAGFADRKKCPIISHRLSYRHTSLSSCLCAKDAMLHRLFLLKIE